MAVCVAVIASENYPLYILTTSPQQELKFHYIVHACLDVIEEKASSLTKASNDPREHYLGTLYPTEDYRVYGYVANTKVKFVIVVEAANTVLRDGDIRTMFRKLHTGYTDMISNPFYIPGDQIKSKGLSSNLSETSDLIANRDLIHTLTSLKSAFTPFGMEPNGHGLALLCKGIARSFAFGTL